MDIEKMIERYHNLANRWENGEQLLLDGTMRIQGELREGATALSTLQAENEKLRAELERERDAAVEDLETIMFVGGQNTDTCMYCKNEQCYGRGGSQLCNPQWRGPQKED